MGTGAGLSYAGLGATHHSLDDLGALSLLPNMQVLAPCDQVEVGALLRAAIKSRKPTYIRLGKKGEPILHQSPLDAQVGRVIEICSGEKVLIVGVGNMVSECRDAANIFKESFGIQPEIISLASVKPLDEDYFEKAFEKFKMIVTVEEHCEKSGAGSIILNWAHKNGKDTRKLRILGAPDEFITSAGTQLNARVKLGLDSKTIYEKIRL